MLFRKGVRPEVEDATNLSGGHFTYHLRQNLGGGTLDELWNNVVLGMIGETIEPADMLVGVRLVDKLGAKQPCVRIEVWFAAFEESEKVELLQKSLEKCVATKLDGSVSSEKERNWGKKDTQSHDEVVKKYNKK